MSNFIYGCPAQFVEKKRKVFFLHSISFTQLPKINQSYFFMSISGHYSVPFIYLYILSPMLHYLDYYSFIVSFKNR